METISDSCDDVTLSLFPVENESCQLEGIVLVNQALLHSECMGLRGLTVVQSVYESRPGIKSILYQFHCKNTTDGTRIIAKEYTSKGNEETDCDRGPGLTNVSMNKKLAETQEKDDIQRLPRRQASSAPNPLLMIEIIRGIYAKTNRY